VASWSMQPFGRNGYGPKIGGLCPFGGGGAGSPSNTMWPGTRPTCMPSFILICQGRLATIHQRHRQTDRETGRQTDRRDNGPIALGEPFYKQSPKNDTDRAYVLWCTLLKISHKKSIFALPVCIGYVTAYLLLKYLNLIYIAIFRQYREFK